MTHSFVNELEQRFTRYVKVDTTSDENFPSAPSTTKQFDLLRLLADELREMQAEDVLLTETGLLYATIPATLPINHDNNVPTVAYFAHVDTSPAFSGEGVRPLVHRQYDGGKIVLPDDMGQVIDPAAFPYLAEKTGEDIVTASGLTLLGADDKAGVAICMTLASHLLAAGDEIAHGRVRLCFTPDEEIGRGVSNIDLDLLGADVAYTLDGGRLGEIESETFSADKFVVKIKGVSAHPGYAKDVLVNALHLAAKMVEALPQAERAPETTHGREPFIHIYELNGGAAEAELRFISRGFELDDLQENETIIRQICDELQASEPRAEISLTVSNQYRNMRYWLEEDMTPVHLAVEAIRACGIEPIEHPIRGGTDGSRLTEMGLPTPNLFTGMQNFHGPLEWVSLQDMEKAVEVCVALTKLWGEKERG